MELNLDIAFKYARMNTEVKKVPFHSPSCKFLIHLVSKNENSEVPPNILMVQAVQSIILKSLISLKKKGNRKIKEK